MLTAAYTILNKITKHQCKFESTFYDDSKSITASNLQTLFLRVNSNYALPIFYQTYDNKIILDRETICGFASDDVMDSIVNDMIYRVFVEKQFTLKEIIIMFFESCNNSLLKYELKNN